MDQEAEGDAVAVDEQSPEQTDNGPRPEDGEQTLPQDPDLEMVSDPGLGEESE